jgi:O-antigen/teichoic acid export membrane protein
MNGKKFATDVSWIFSSTLVISAVGFLRRPVMAYYIGAEGIGLWAMLFGITSLFSMMNLGIPAATTKYVAQYKDQKDTMLQFVSASLILSVGLGIITTVALFVTGDRIAQFFSMPSLVPLIKLIAVSIPPFYVFRSIVAALNGVREMKKASILTGVSGLLSVALTLFPLGLGFGLEGAAAGHVGAVFISAVIAFFFSRKILIQHVNQYSLSLTPVKTLLSFGVQTVIANIGQVVQYEIDTLMIGYFLTPAQVGIYSVSSSIARALWVIPQSVNTVSYPTFSYYWGKGDYEAVRTLFDKSIKYTACLLMPLGLGVALFGKDLILLLFEEQFVYAVLPLQILVLGAVAKGAWISIGSIFSAIGRVDLGYKISPVTTVVNVVLNYLFIPAYGIVGAAVATVTSFFIILAVSAFLAKRIAHVVYDLPWITKAVALTLVILAAFFVFRTVTYYGAAGAVLIVYAGFIYTFLLKKEDRLYIRDVLKTGIKKD